MQSTARKTFRINNTKQYVSTYRMIILQMLLIATENGNLTS